ncbi:MAG: hypothetical protein IJO96_02665, partial [Oscillospiraceae bacterium]|nr:hypothetical protein [Oscillospiraceae bacterium]
SCAKDPPPYRTPEEREGVIFAISNYKINDDGKERCTLVVLYDTADDATKSAAIVPLGSHAPITRDGSIWRVKMSDLEVGQRIRFTVMPMVICKPNDPEWYGLDSDTQMNEYYGCQKVVILSDGEE